MDLCGYREVSVNLWTFSIDHDYAQPRALRFILSECCISIVCLELLYLLEMRLLCYRPHGGEVERLEGQFSKVVGVGLLGG